MSDHHNTVHRNPQNGGDTCSRRLPPRVAAHRRKLHIYSESLSGLNEDYVAQTLRLIELDMAAITNMHMIDRFMQRLAPIAFDTQSAPRVLECLA